MALSSPTLRTAPRRGRRLTWAGSQLVIVRASDDGVAMRIEASVSPDGRKLTRAFHVDSSQGAADWTYVYDRVR